MTAIAIDGPAGAGKSTIARALAQKLGYLYLDTRGSLPGHRSSTAWSGASRPGTRPLSQPHWTASMWRCGMWTGRSGCCSTGEDVSEAIRRPEISLAASAVSADWIRCGPFCSTLQRDMARTHDVVMDGRDIGTVVLPDARVKIFLTASLEERTRRRQAEYAAKGEERDFDELLREMDQRDRQDRTRAVAPLRRAEDAVELDSTSLSADEVLAAIESILKEKA